MASKRKITNMTKKFSLSSYLIDDSDDMNPVSKRKRKNILDTSDSDDSQVLSSTSALSKRTANEIHAQQDLFDFTEKPGPQCCFPYETKPIEYFNLFFDSSLWSLMVQETNRYAEELLQSLEASKTSRIKMWKPVTVVEMKAFVAVLLEMGITRRPSIFSYWAENSRNIPWFQKMFSRNRFQLILQCFHLVDNKQCFPSGHEKYDPCAKFGPLVNHANRVFRLHYTPHKELSIAESLVGTSCHSSSTQYLPNKKHHRSGIKFWMVCDAWSKYCLCFYCYQGAKTKASDNKTKQLDLGYDVVVNLLQESDYLNKGYHVFVENFLSSITLAKYLYSRGTYLTGTIRRNRKDIPNDLKKLNVNETKYFQDEEVLLCAYREKKETKNPVVLISTHTSNEDTTIINKQHGNVRRITKPCIITSYNSFMCRVDESDKMLYAHLDERRTVKYWKKVVFNIFDRMVLNAYLIYKETVGIKAISRFEFTSNIIFEIECEWMEEKKQQLVNNEKKTFGLIKLPGRNLRQCTVCKNKTNDRKRSNLICVHCRKGVHPLCFDKHVCYKI